MFFIYCSVVLHAKLMQSLNLEQFEMAYAMALVDKKMHLAQISIAACWKGLRVRRALIQTTKARRRAIWTI